MLSLANGRETSIGCCLNGRMGGVGACMIEMMSCAHHLTASSRLPKHPSGGKLVDNPIKS